MPAGSAERAVARRQVVVSVGEALHSAFAEDAQQGIAGLSSTLEDGKGLAPAAHSGDLVLHPIDGGAGHDLSALHAVRHLPFGACAS